MIKRIKKWIFNYRLKEAIKTAEESAQRTGLRHLVLLIQGKPMVFTKRQVQRLIRVRYFRKGTTIQGIEERALFITKPMKPCS